MKILFITRLYSPHIGGVEKHIAEVSKRLKGKGESIIVLTEKYDESLKKEEVICGIKIVRFHYPHIKFLGLLMVWREIFILKKLVEEADIIHIHDVFIWYLPFKFIYPGKKVYLTAHGLEFDDPLSKVSIWQKRLAVELSRGTIGVGKYLEKYIGVRFNKIIYGAIYSKKSSPKKIKNSIVYVGRLDESTGLGKFLKWLGKNKKYSVNFCGDGPMRADCEKVGRVNGFVRNPSSFLAKSEYCVPGGYLSALEALNNGCRLKLFWNTKIRGDIWKDSPFVKKDARRWARKQTWEKLANEYLDLYNNI